MEPVPDTPPAKVVVGDTASITLTTAMRKKKQLKNCMKVYILYFINFILTKKGNIILFKETKTTAQSFFSIFCNIHCRKLLYTFLIVI